MGHEHLALSETPEVAGSTSWGNPVPRVVGPVNLPGRMPLHSSEMLARNLYSFTAPLVREGELSIDWADEVLAGTAFTHAGRVVHPGVRRTLGLEEPPTDAPSPPGAPSPSAPEQA